MSTPSIQGAVHEAVRRARAAQALAGAWSQDHVDDVVAAVAWRCYREDNARRLATLSHTETGLGDPEHLYELQRKRVIGQLFELHGQTTVGTVENHPELSLRKIAKPVGVIAAASPATAPSAGIVCNTLPMLKTRNAVVFTPNPRARTTAMETIDVIREALADIGAPADLVQCLQISGREAAEALMAAADLVVAVGGPGTVRRAYASGTPAVGAGVGNSTVIVDETCDITSAAATILTGASYNNGTSCSSESNVLVHSSVSSEFRAELTRSHAHVCTRDETERVRKALWPDGRTLDRDLIGKPAGAIALAAGIILTEPTMITTIVLDGDGEAAGSPALGEKLSPVLTLLTYDHFDDAVERVHHILEDCGRGHSAGIHSRSPERQNLLAHRIPACRIVVNQSTMTNSGSFTSGVPFTATLSSGTWGGTSVSGNVTWRSYVNLTTVTGPIAERHPDEKALFGRHAAAAASGSDTARVQSRRLENVL
ncbi:aldehyde dehydrogenase family protein [Streptomyces sp. NBC_00859]|uniref:aldehyde dehydrogenase family protein n=1 Tax=Streptomyces sp. NBC_00859 TaxID=2903682 RepID=UPI00386469D7|nr:aldehyde dehydrogenase family protein [Streptomyces sp. NBC_00859]